MQFRCYSCKMPISIGRAVVEGALDIIHEDDLDHYNFQCPKCKKTNRVSKEQLLHAAPAWEYKPTAMKAESESGAKKPPAKETAAKKAPDKKETAKKAPTKKAAAKKAPAKESSDKTKSGE